jgi:hypothetical protein
MMTGCADEAAKKNVQTREDVNKTLSRMQGTNAGYVPKGEGVGATEEERVTGLEHYQIKKNSENAADLKKLVANLSPDQKPSVWMILANADMQAALVASRDARVEGARICSGSIGLMNRLAAAANTQVLAGAFKKSLDGSTTRELDTLLKGYQSELETQKALAAKLTKDAAALQVEIDALGTEADKLNAGVRDLRQSAFVKSGNAQLDLYKQAANIEIEAQKQLTKRQIKSVSRDMIVSQLAMAVANQQSLQQSVDTLQTQVQQSQARTKELDAKVRSLESSSSASLAGVLELYNELEASRKKVVEPGFAEAVKRAKEAVNSAEEAAKAAKGDQERYYKLELLGKRELYLDIMVQQLAFEQDYCETLSLVTKIGADQGVAVSDTLLQGPQRFAKTQQDLGQKAWTEYSAAATLVTELTGGVTNNEDPLVVQAQAAFIRLQALQKSLDHLAPGGGVAPAAAPEAK